MSFQTAKGNLRHEHHTIKNTDMEAYKNTFKENVKHKIFVLFGFVPGYHLSLLPRNVLEKYIQIVFITKQMYVYTYNKTPYRPVTKSAVHEKLLSP